MWNPFLPYKEKYSYMQRGRGIQSQHETRQRQTGKMFFRFRARWKVTHDVALKTHQRGRTLQIRLSFSSFLFLLAFLSVTQYLPGAVYSGPLLHSSVALASASPGVFMLYFLSPRLPLRTVGYSLRILSFFHFCLLKYPPHFSSDEAFLLLVFDHL